MTAEPPNLLNYALTTGPRPAQGLEALSTAMAFFGAAATAGGTLLAIGIEWLDKTLFLTQTHSVTINLHLVSLALALVAVIGVLSTLSACCITVNKARRFSLQVAVIQLIVFPIGTVLGLLTFFMLMRSTVRRCYAPAKA